MQHHFDEHSRKRLMELLDEKSLTHNTMRSDEVQGFMMALLSGPDALTPEDWLPEVLGEEALFEAKERTEVERLVLALAVDMRRQMSDKHLPDLWLYEDNAGNPDFYTWCNAYLYALEVVPTNWFETVNQEEFEDLFYPIMALGGIYDEEENGEIVLHLTDSELTELESDLPHTLLDIYFYWQAIINKPKTVRRTEAKVGRNDPCPCGSGKKSGKQVENPYRQQGQDNGQRTADFGNHADNEADKRTHADFACLQHIPFGNELANSRTDERAEQQAGQGKEGAGNAADERAP